MKSSSKDKVHTPAASPPRVSLRQLHPCVCRTALLAMDARMLTRRRHPPPPTPTPPPTPPIANTTTVTTNNSNIDHNSHNNIINGGERHVTKRVEHYSTISRRCRTTVKHGRGDYMFEASDILGLCWKARWDLGFKVLV